MMPKSQFPYLMLAVCLLSYPAVLGCNTTEGALWGAGLGAGTGALAGSLSGRAGAGTAIGAGAGALMGGLIGHQFEEMEKQRQAQQANQYPPGYPVGGTGPHPVNQPYSPQPYYPPAQRTTTSGVIRGEQPSTDQPQTATPITTVVNCPNCNQALDVSDFRKGSKVRCPACNEVFVY